MVCSSEVLSGEGEINGVGTGGVEIVDERFVEIGTGHDGIEGEDDGVEVLINGYDDGVVVSINGGGNWRRT